MNTLLETGTLGISPLVPLLEAVVLVKELTTLNGTIELSYIHAAQSFQQL